MGICRILRYKTWHPIGHEFVRELKTDLTSSWPWICPWIEDWHPNEGHFGREFVRVSKTYLNIQSVLFSSVKSSVNWRQISSRIKDKLVTQSMPFSAVNSNVNRRQTWPLINAIFGRELKYSWNIFRVLNVCFRSLSLGILYNAMETWMKSLQKWCQLRRPDTQRITTFSLEIVREDWLANQSMAIFGCKNAMDHVWNPYENGARWL